MVRLYDPSKGKIFIDDQLINKVSLGSLRSQIAVVPQSPVLFSGTIGENICLARPDATKAEIETAARLSSALSFIKRLEHGFDTYIGAGGTSLSGGEAQRIAIARALLTRPKILLLDEPTSALDPDSESSVLKSLIALKGEITIIVVSHRLETIRHADKIVILQHGRIVQEGTHMQLLAQSETYRELFVNNDPLHKSFR
jgi:ABC-type multidrug transport system fused ATPase/permease subunit